ncbi:MAG: hydroxymethylglutaryl-CoA lyase [Planctomycetota bacterium]|nr:hydroxymethylglutaryl-CoA lyase [Planctomycetota bacterium]
MSSRVRITDVSPRDGLQNEKAIIPVADKVRLVELLCATGVDEIEVTSFVSPKWVPQLGDAAEVLRAVASHPSPDALKHRTPQFSALVPNAKGFESAQALAAELGRWPVQKLSVFTAASETFNQKNTNASIAESIERFRPVIAGARAAGVRMRGYISCVIACPFEGPIAVEQVALVARLLEELGVDEIDLGDTIGAGDAHSTRAMLEAVVHELGPQWLGVDDAGEPRLTLHLHDTFGRAAECVRAALDAGVRSFDGAVGGLGGCPYASTPQKRAPGNINTLALVRAVHEAGFTTGVDEDALVDAARFALKIVGRDAETAS